MRVVDIGALVIGFFAVGLQIFPPQTKGQQTVSVVFFIAILCYVILFYGYEQFYRKMKFYIDEINATKKEVSDLCWQLRQKNIFTT